MLRHNFQNFFKSKILLLAFMGLALGTSQSAHAFSLFSSGFIYGVGFGFGNMNIDKDVTFEGDTYSLSRTEGPGMLTLSIEGFINDKWSLALSHRRGARLGPFSMGIGFTGVIARYYFFTPPALPQKDLKNSVIVKRWSPFVGIGSGIAIGSASREGEVVDTISTSGFYMGGHAGLDYQWSSNLILRPELFFSTTLLNDSIVPSALGEMGLSVGFHFRL